MERDRLKLAISVLFFAFLHPKTPKNQKFEKMKKLKEISFYTCTKNHNHMMHGS